MGHRCACCILGCLVLLTLHWLGSLSLHPRVAARISLPSLAKTTPAKPKHTDQPLSMAAGPSIEQLQEMDVDFPAVATAGGGGGGGGTPSASRGIGPAITGAGSDDEGGDATEATAGGDEQLPGGGAAAAAGGGVGGASAAAGGPPAEQQGGIRGAVAAMAAAAAAAAAAKTAQAAGAAGGGASAGKFVCLTCGKVVNSEGGLKKHMLVHGEKNFLCTFPGCGRVGVMAG